MVQWAAKGVLKGEKKRPDADVRESLYLPHRAAFIPYMIKSPCTAIKLNLGQNRGAGMAFCMFPSGQRLIFFVRSRKWPDASGLFALSGKLTAPQSRFKCPGNKIHAKGPKIEIWGF